jgi:hypothetical protein
MKGLSIFFCLTIFFSCQNQNEVFTSGPEIFNQQKFYLASESNTDAISVEKMERFWSDIISEEGEQEIEFVNHRILVREQKGEKTYWLTADGKEECLNISTRVVKGEDGFLIKNGSIGKTCACMGCNDCEVVVENGDCRCENLTPLRDNCSKIERVQMNS